MLHPCTQCRRHVRDDETECPFCGSPHEPASTAVPFLDGRLSRAAVFASAVLAAPACVAQDPPPQYIQQPPPPPPDNRPPPPPDNGPPPDYAKPPPGDPPPPPPVAETTIRGVITNGNTRARLANIRIDLQGGTKPQSAMTNAAGEYVFTNVPPGDYSVIARVQINPRGGGGGNIRQVRVDGNPQVVNLNVFPYEPRYDRSNIPKPYGAPPARHRIV